VLRAAAVLVISRGGRRLAVHRGASLWSRSGNPGNLGLERSDRLLDPVDRSLLKIGLTALFAEPSGNRVDDEMVSVPVNRIGDPGPDQLSPAEMALQTPRLLVL
jgi:hypothetical protein